ncbi:MAG: hypothetical protein AABZ31_13530 [Bdellovibrionota bacterium]
MKKNNAALFSLFGLTLTLLAAPLVQASEDYSSYDDIIKNLKGSEISAAYSGTAKSDFDSIKIHAGAGLVNSNLRLDTPKGLASNATVRGVELFVGIDLFSPAWIAEGAVRTFTSERFSGTTLSLREFDLKVISRNQISKTMFWRAGAGMSARYLDFAEKPAQLEKRAYTTPASEFVAGLGAQFSPAFSAGIDLSYKNSLINDTIDKSSVDGNIRLTGTF